MAFVVRKDTVNSKIDKLRVGRTLKKHVIMTCRGQMQSTTLSRVVA